MNKKEELIYKIVDIVVDCCATQIDDVGTMSITREDVLGKNRSDNAVMTRCILVSMLTFAGYSTTTIAQLLGRTTQAVRHLLELGNNYSLTSRAYKIADAEATVKCKEIT